MAVLRPFLHCKCFDHKNYGDWKLQGPCRENLHYLWKRAVRISEFLTKLLTFDHFDQGFLKIKKKNPSIHSFSNIFLPGWMEKICQESSHSLVIDVSTNNYKLSAIRFIFSSVPTMKKTHEKCMSIHFGQNILVG